jgi:hypothetical protein
LGQPQQATLVEKLVAIRLGEIRRGTERRR